MTRHPLLGQRSNRLGRVANGPRVHLFYISHARHVVGARDKFSCITRLVRLKVSKSGSEIVFRRRCKRLLHFEVTSGTHFRLRHRRYMHLRAPSSSRLWLRRNRLGQQLRLVSTAPI